MARFWQERFSQLIDRMSLTGGLRRVAIVILGLALRVPESRLGFQVGAELNFSAVSFFGFSVTQLPLSAPSGGRIRRHRRPFANLPSYPKRHAGRSGEHRGGAPAEQPTPAQKPHVAAHRPHVAPSRAKLAQHGHPGEKAHTGATSAKVAPEGNWRPPGQRNRRGPRPAEALRRRLPVGAPRTRKSLLAVARPRRRASRPRGERCGQ